MAGGRFAGSSAASGKPIALTLPGDSAAHLYAVPVATAGWTLAFVIPDAIAYAPLQDLLRQAIAVTVISLLLMLGVVFIMAHQLVRPLAEVGRAARDLAETCLCSLAEGMHAFAKGDLTRKAAAGTVAPVYHSDDELGETAEAIRGMVGSVHTTLAAYEEARASLVETATVGRALSMGDLTRSVAVRSEVDLLGHAFSSMVEYQREMAANARAIATGDLTPYKLCPRERQTRSVTPSRPWRATFASWLPESSCRPHGPTAGPRMLPAPPHGWHRQAIRSPTPSGGRSIGKRGKPRCAEGAGAGDHPAGGGARVVCERSRAKHRRGTH